MNETLKMIIDFILVLAGSGAMATVMTAIFERRRKRAEVKKIEMDYADQLSKTAMTLVEPLKTEVERLNKRVDRLERLVSRYSQRIAYLMGGIEQLLHQVVGLRQDPCWRPNDWSPEKVED